MPIHEPAAPWWRSGVFYQIYPRSFADGNRDGTGDLQGLLRRLDYLAWLGVDALWLSPIYLSPMKDGGYDVADYQHIDPRFGTLDDFDRLLDAAHERGLRVLLDWVPNHTSDQHPWFRQSRASRHNPKSDWYIWRDTPNNWRSELVDQSAWNYDEQRGQYYLHSFLPEQPDLNWANPAVEDAMLASLRFWLERGVDGFRADAINVIAKDRTFGDLPLRLARYKWTHVQDHPAVHGILRRIRQVLDGYPQRPVMIGELWLTDPAAIDRYYGRGDELQLLFNFRLAEADWQAARWRQVLAQTERHAHVTGHWPSPVLGNHDLPRLLTRLGSLPKARAAALLLLTLPGAPFIYAGDELGLANAAVVRPIDPGGRDGERAPIPWDREAPYGWPAQPWLPFPANVADANWQAELHDPQSILYLYRRLLWLRRASPDLTDEAFQLLDAPDGLLAYRRGDMEIIANFTDRPRLYRPHRSMRVLISSASLNRAAYTGRLRPHEAVILEPLA